MRDIGFLELYKEGYISKSPNSLSRVIGDHLGSILGVIQGDTRSVDYGACRDDWRCMV